MSDPDDVRVVEDTLRTYVDGTGYGVMITDKRLKEIALLIVQALDDAHSGTVI